MYSLRTFSDDHHAANHLNQDQQWALGFDFPDFGLLFVTVLHIPTCPSQLTSASFRIYLSCLDHAIARGVARDLPPTKAIQVRTRRWIRTRRRQLRCALFVCHLISFLLNCLTHKHSHNQNTFHFKCNCPCSVSSTRRPYSVLVEL